VVYNKLNDVSFSSSVNVVSDEFLFLLIFYLKYS